MADALAVLNRALAAQRVAAADPLQADADPARALAARVGYGLGEQVAEGDWESARELRAPRERRSRALVPQQRLAALLSGRDVALACEELALRARGDLDAGRQREAAMQLHLALEAAVAELESWRARHGRAHRRAGGAPRGGRGRGEHGDPGRAGAPGRGGGRRPPWSGSRRRCGRAPRGRPRRDPERQGTALGREVGERGAVGDPPPFSRPVAVRASRHRVDGKSSATDAFPSTRFGGGAYWTETVTGAGLPTLPTQPSVARSPARPGDGGRARPPAPPHAARRARGRRRRSWRRGGGKRGCGRRSTGPPCTMVLVPYQLVR